MNKIALFIILLLTLSACSGIRTTDKSYSAHAENVNFLFMRIPGGDTHERAMALLPKGAEIKTIKSDLPMDTSSFWGVMNRIIGFDVTIVSGTIEKDSAI